MGSHNAESAELRVAHRLSKQPPGEGAMKRGRTGRSKPGCKEPANASSACVRAGGDYGSGERAGCGGGSRREGMFILG